MNVENNQQTNSFTPQEAAREIRNYASQKGVKLGLLEQIYTEEQADQLMIALHLKVGHYVELKKALEMLLTEVDKKIVAESKNNPNVKEGQRTGLPKDLQDRIEFANESSRRCELKLSKWAYIFNVVKDIKETMKKETEIESR